MSEGQTSDTRFGKTDKGYYSKSPYYITKGGQGSTVKFKGNRTFDERGNAIKDKSGDYVYDRPEETFVALSQFSPIASPTGQAQQFVKLGDEATAGLIAEDDARVQKDQDLQSGKTLELTKKRNAALEKKTSQDAATRVSGKKKPQATGTLLTDTESVGSILGSGKNLLGG